MCVGGDVAKNGTRRHPSSPPSPFPTVTLKQMPMWGGGCTGCAPSPNEIDVIMATGTRGNGRRAVGAGSWLGGHAPLCGQRGQLPAADRCGGQQVSPMSPWPPPPPLRSARTAPRSAGPRRSWAYWTFWLWTSASRRRCGGSLPARAWSRASTLRARSTCRDEKKGQRGRKKIKNKVTLFRDRRERSVGRGGGHPRWTLVPDAQLNRRSVGLLSP